MFLIVLKKNLIFVPMLRKNILLFCCFFAFLGFMTAQEETFNDTDSLWSDEEIENNFKEYHQLQKENQAQNDYETQAIDLKKVDAKEWQRLKDPQKKKEKKEKNKDLKAEKPEEWSELAQKIFLVLKYLFIAAVVFFLGYLLYYYVVYGGLGAKSTVLTPSELIEKEVQAIEENLLDSDIAPLLAAALKDQNWALATRLLYLITLQKLAFGEWIIWKKDKTNNRYYAELLGNPLTEPIRADFKTVTLAFEEVRYGDKTLNENDFYSLKSKFDTMLGIIPKKE